MHTIILVKSSLFFSPVGSIACRNAVDSNNKASKNDRMQLNTFFVTKIQWSMNAVTSQIKVKQS